MTAREITVLTDISLITCIVQRGLADTIIEAAREAGAQGATVHFARGMGSERAARYFGGCGGSGKRSGRHCCFQGTGGTCF